MAMSNKILTEHVAVEGRSVHFWVAPLVISEAVAGIVVVVATAAAGSV